jgi:hypothetical protein
MMQPIRDNQRLFISQRAVDLLKFYQRKSVEEVREYTGALIGYEYSPHVITIEWLTAEAGQFMQATRNLNEVELEGLPHIEEIDNGSIFYVGEWHSHLESNDFSDHDAGFFDVPVVDTELYRGIVSLLAGPSGYRLQYRRCKGLHVQFGLYIGSMQSYDYSGILLER